MSRAVVSAEDEQYILVHDTNAAISTSRRHPTRIDLGPVLCGEIELEQVAAVASVVASEYVLKTRYSPHRFAVCLCVPCDCCRRQLSESGGRWVRLQWFE